MAVRANILIDQGADYSTVISMTDDDGNVISLSGYTGNSIIKKTYSSSNVAATFNVSVNASLGQVTLSLTAAQTANIAAGRYVYDVKLIDGSNVAVRIVEGIATISPKVT